MTNFEFLKDWFKTGVEGVVESVGRIINPDAADYIWGEIEKPQKKRTAQENLNEMVINGNEVMKNLSSYIKRAEEKLNNKPKPRMIDINSLTEEELRSLLSQKEKKPFISKEENDIANIDTDEEVHTDEKIDDESAPEGSEDKLKTIKVNGKNKFRSSKDNEFESYLEGLSGDPKEMYDLLSDEEKELFRNLEENKRIGFLHRCVKKKKS